MTQSPAEEGLDFGKLWADLRRGWPVVAACSAGGLLTAAVLTARTPKLWQADFQIVLADSNEQGSLSSLLSRAGGGLGALLGAGGEGGSSLATAQETELKILQSPSVLLPVFEYVRSLQPPQARAGMTLPGWAWAVSAKAAKNTSVLEVSYQGTNPQEVLAASRKLAETYQQYSGRKRQRSLQALIDYLQEQIAIYRPRAAASRAQAEAFANRYTLTSADAVPASGSGSSAGSLDLGGLLSGVASSIGGNSSGSLKAQQADLQKRIRELRFQLARVQQAGDREPINLNNTGGGGVLGNLIGGMPGNASLQDLDRVIAERRSRLRDNDPTVATLLRQRRVLIGSMNRQLAQELQNAIALAQSQLTALERPAGVLERFQQLSQEANRDEQILQKLENTLEEQKLELARDSQPWELISAPTLQDKPVKPVPRTNLALGLLAGLLSGTASTLLLERRKGLVFHTDELLELLPYPLLGQLNSGHSERWSGVLELLAHGPLQRCPQVALVPVGTVDTLAEPLAAALQGTLQQQDPAAQVLLSRDLVQASRAQAQLLVACLGAAHRPELEQLQQDLQLQGKPVAGVLLLSSPQAGDDA